MIFDGLIMSAAANEMRRNLLGARVDKIYQPFGLKLTMTVRQPGKNIKILISAEPKTARVHITQAEYENPYNPPPFCMLLRKHLISSRIIQIDQVGLDRILRITFLRSPEETPKVLVVETMGRHSNISLIHEDSGIILDSIKRIGSDRSRVRQLGPGLKYVFPPPQDKLNILLMSKDDLDERLTIFQNREPSVQCSKFLVSSFTGFGRETAIKILHKAGITPDSPCVGLNKNNIETLRQVLFEVADSVREGCFFPNVGRLLDSYYSHRQNKEALSRLRTELADIIADNIARCRRKQEARNNEISKAEKDLSCRKFGELLLAGASDVYKGMEKIKLLDYFDPSGGEVEIPLNPRLSVYENAQCYFRRYTRAKRVLEATTPQMDMTQSDLEYLEQVATTVEQAGSQEELRIIRDELVEEGYLEEVQRDKKKSKAKRVSSKISPSPLSFTAEGFTILVGRNNAENDFITMKIARPQDVWMHARGIPGAHVVIKSDSISAEVPENVLMIAAGIAAYFSRGRTSHKIEVDYTLRKHVKKPKGARPGMVIYDHQKTIIGIPCLPDPNVTK